MTSMSALVALLLAVGGLLLVVAATGAAVLSGTLDRLHYVGLAATAGAPLVVLGLIVRADDWASGLKLALVGVLLVGTGPATAAVTARARGSSDRDTP